MASHAGTCWILRVIVATIIAMVGMVMIVTAKVGMMIVMMVSHAGTCRILRVIVAGIIVMVGMVKIVIEGWG